MKKTMKKMLMALTMVFMVCAFSSCTETELIGDKFEPVLFNISGVTIAPYPYPDGSVYIWYGNIPQVGSEFDISSAMREDGEWDTFFPRISVNGEVTLPVVRTIEEICNLKETTDILEGEWGKVVYNPDTHPYCCKFVINPNQASEPRYFEITLEGFVRHSFLRFTQPGKAGEQ